MRDISKYRKLICVMLAWFLLSFFDMAGQSISAQRFDDIVDHSGSEQETMLICTKQVPNGVDKFVKMESKTSEIASKKENTSQELMIRFVAIVTVLFFAIQVIYHTTIQRYGCHMIDVWENIIYIHQTDGKKRSVLLCS